MPQGHMDSFPPPPKWKTGIIRRETWDTRSVGFGGSEVVKEGTLG